MHPFFSASFVSETRGWRTSMHGTSPAITCHKGKQGGTFSFAVDTSPSLSHGPFKVCTGCFFSFSFFFSFLTPPMKYLLAGCQSLLASCKMLYKIGILTAATEANWPHLLQQMYWYILMQYACLSPLKHRQVLDSESVYGQSSIIFGSIIFLGTVFDRITLQGNHVRPLKINFQCQN